MDTEIEVGHYGNRCYCKFCRNFHDTRLNTDSAGTKLNLMRTCVWPPRWIIFSEMHYCGQFKDISGQ